MNEFDWIIIGEQPGGLWLLDRLCREVEGGRPLKVGWIRLGELLRPLAVPKAVAAEFSLPIEDSWSLEISTPNQSWIWNHSEGRKALSPSNFRDLRQDPELILHLQALWKYLGASENLSEDSLFQALHPCRELVWWNPQISGKAVTEISGSFTNWTFESREDHTVLNFSDQTWAAPRCIWNSSLIKSHDLIIDQFDDILAFNQDALSASGICPVEIQLEPLGVPAHISPLLFRLAYDGIVDINHEVWPIEIHRKESYVLLRVWISVRRQCSLEDILEKGGRAVSALRTLFPYFDDTLLSIFPPLYGGDCIAESDRNKIESWFENSFREFYTLTALHTERHSVGLIVLPPNSSCHLPYPVGPLMSARNIFEDWKKTTPPSQR